MILNQLKNFKTDIDFEIYFDDILKRYNNFTYSEALVSSAFIYKMLLESYGAYRIKYREIRFYANFEVVLIENLRKFEFDVNSILKMGNTLEDMLGIATSFDSNIVTKETSDNITKESSTSLGSNFDSQEEDLGLDSLSKDSNNLDRLNEQKWTNDKVDKTMSDKARKNMDKFQAFYRNLLEGFRTLFYMNVLSSNSERIDNPGIFDYLLVNGDALVKEIVAAKDFRSESFTSYNETLRLINEDYKKIRKLFLELYDHLEDLTNGTGNIDVREVVVREDGGTNKSKMLYDRLEINKDWFFDIEEGLKLFNPYFELQRTDELEDRTLGLKAMIDDADERITKLEESGGAEWEFSEELNVGGGFVGQTKNTYDFGKIYKVLESNGTIDYEVFYIDLSLIEPELNEYRTQSPLRNAQVSYFINNKKMNFNNISGRTTTYKIYKNKV